jgi:hypothetical protein
MLHPPCPSLLVAISLPVFRAVTMLPASVPLRVAVTTPGSIGHCETASEPGVVWGLSAPLLMTGCHSSVLDLDTKPIPPCPSAVPTPHTALSLWHLTLPGFPPYHSLHPAALLNPLLLPWAPGQNSWRGSRLTSTALGRV